MKRIILILFTLGVSVAAVRSEVKKSAVPGITNFAQVEATVTCAGR